MIVVHVIGFFRPGKAFWKRALYQGSFVMRRSTWSLLASVTPISTGSALNSGTSICRSSETSAGLAQVSVEL
jgi:hypothetical protein